MLIQRYQNDTLRTGCFTITVAWYVAAKVSNAASPRVARRGYLGIFIRELRRGKSIREPRERTPLSRDVSYFQAHWHYRPSQERGPARITAGMRAGEREGQREDEEEGRQQPLFFSFFYLRALRGHVLRWIIGRLIFRLSQWRIDSRCNLPHTRVRVTQRDRLHRHKLICHPFWRFLIIAGWPRFRVYRVDRKLVGNATPLATAECRCEIFLWNDTLRV